MFGLLIVAMLIAGIVLAMQWKRRHLHASAGCPGFRMPGVRQARPDTQVTDQTEGTVEKPAEVNPTTWIAALNFRRAAQPA